VVVIAKIVALSYLNINSMMDLKNLKHSKLREGYTSTTLPFNKTNFQVIEQERSLLKITLDYVAKENESLKQQIEDMKTTVKHNKNLLKEYIDTITSKDKVVEKMNATIEQLTTRLHSLEEYIKTKYLLMLFLVRVVAAQHERHMKGW
jgi:uncharacterized coiled-coil protein SlyX